MRILASYFSWLCLMVFSSLAHAQLTSLNESFTSCTGSFPPGWQQYSAQGPDVWQCTNSGYAGRGITISGYSGGNYNINEDWLISPALNFSTYSMPQLSFWSWTKFQGAYIQVLVSTNYVGSGNPAVATWTVLNPVLPNIASEAWVNSGQVDLSAYKNQVMHVAFKYLSTAVSASQWRLDDVMVSDGSVSFTKRFVNVGATSMGSTSASSTFGFTLSSISGSLVLEASYPFELSKNGINFSTSLTYQSADAGVLQTVHVRIAPNEADKVYRSVVQLILNGVVLSPRVYVMGSSIPHYQSVKVATWNMKWLGDPQNCACDTALAKQHAIEVLRDLGADMYHVQEVVSVNQLSQITAALGQNYGFAVSTFCSGVTNTSSGLYNACQKLAFVYNKDKIEPLGHYGLLASTYPADTNAYYCFASGRFPHVMPARIKLANGANDTVVFVNIHAKAGSTTTDYNRRLCASNRMRDSLNALYPGKKIMIAGDYNDYVVGSHVSGQSVSPYNNLLANGYAAMSLPSLFVGQTTFVGSSNHIIDNISVSNSLQNLYIDSSCFIFNEPIHYIPNYASASSDHFPVMAYYRFMFHTTVGLEEELSLYQDTWNMLNPVQNGKLLFWSDTYESGSLRVTIFDLQGRQLRDLPLVAIAHGQYHTDVKDLQDGLYVVRVITNKGVVNQVFKLIKKS